MQFREQTNVRKLTLITLLAVSIDAAAQAGAWHPITDIAQVAEDFVAGQMRKDTTGGSSRIKAAMLDGRLRLAACDRPLEAFLRPGSKIGVKTIVGVRCSGHKPWKMYVPVETTVRKSVWVASRPLPRGHLLTQADLSAAIRDISRMHAGYILNNAVLVGQRLRQPVLAGRAFTPGLVEADNVVQRGQSVTLAVSIAGVSIRVTGKALMDGAVNQRIRVENLTSGRIVEGIVRSRELIEILLPATNNGSAVVGKRFQAKPKVSPSLADTGHSNNDR